MQQQSSDSIAPLPLPQPTQPLQQVDNQDELTEPLLSFSNNDVERGRETLRVRGRTNNGRRDGMIVPASDDSHDNEVNTILHSEGVVSSFQDIMTIGERGGQQQQRRRRRHRTPPRSRFLDREAPFFQSRGRWSVQHVSRGQARWLHTPQGDSYQMSFSKRLWDNWFHTLASKKTVVLVCILFFVYISLVFIFAGIYLAVSVWGVRNHVTPDGGTERVPFCAMDITTHMEALYFSLSTMATIGYGVSDYYFGGCWTPLLLVMSQVCSAILFDAVAIGVLFQRISRGHKRSKSILFADKAAIRRVRAVPYFHFRVAELRQHSQLLQATVRAYCIRHERFMQNDQLKTSYFVTKPMKLMQEEYILMSLPQVLVHTMIDDSPLLPPRHGWYDANGYLHNADGAGLSLQDIDLFLQDRQAEIIVLLEGTDEITGALIQSRHSYRLSEIAWNCTYAECVFPSSNQESNRNSNQEDVSPRAWASRICARRSRQQKQPMCIVDFAKFHDLITVTEDDICGPYIME